MTAINNAAVTNVTARTINGSAWVLEATGGTNLNFAIKGSGAVSAAATVLASIGIGLASLQAMFGSGAAAAAVGNYNGESSAIAKAVAINAVRGTSQVVGTAQAEHGNSHQRYCWLHPCIGRRLYQRVRHRAL